MKHYAKVFLNRNGSWTYQAIAGTLPIGFATFDSKEGAIAYAFSKGYDADTIEIKA